MLLFMSHRPISEDVDFESYGNPAYKFEVGIHIVGKVALLFVF